MWWRNSINAAMQFCNLPKAEQLEHFIRHSEDRETNKVIRRSITRSKREKISPDIAAVLDALQQQESRQPGEGCTGPPTPGFLASTMNVTH